jgi:SHS2 domain-containing protein
MAAGHRFEDHTGEVELHIRADALAEVYQEAARAVAQLLLNAVPAPPPEAPPVVVELTARDPATLLVDWVNELIFRTEVEHTVFTEIEAAVSEQEGGGEGAGQGGNGAGWRLRATLRGLPDPPLAGQVKAATLHQARVERAGRGYQANLILDV